MQDNKSTVSALYFFYEEGDIDVVYFSFILGFVSFGENDCSFNKTEKQIIKDALLLTNFLIATGDFIPCKAVESNSGTFDCLTFERGISELSEYVQQRFADEGLNSDWQHYEVLLKKVNIGKPPPTEIPDEILKIFQPAKAG